MRQSILFMLACVFLVATLSMCETTPATREDPEPDDCTLETDELDFESTFVGERRYMSVNMEFENISVFPEGETITIGCEDFAFWDPVLEQASDTYTYAWVQGYDVDSSP
jgi:predicted membrane protein